MKQVIARIYPLTNTPVIFDAESKLSGNGRLKAFMDGKDIEVGYDFYMHTEHLEPGQALKIAQAYAKHAKIPEHEVMVRQRFPKIQSMSRKLNDANLKLVQKGADKKDKPETLQQLAQDLHDSETKKKTDEAVKPLEELKKDYGNEGKATADNPQGAKVSRSAGEKAKTKRAYNKQPNKRSEAAMKRYLDELSKNAAQSDTLLQPAVPGPGVTQAEVDDATMQLALKLAKLLQSI